MLEERRTTDVPYTLNDIVYKEITLEVETPLMYDYTISVLREYYPDMLRALHTSVVCKDTSILKKRIERLNTFKETSTKTKIPLTMFLCSGRSWIKVAEDAIFSKEYADKLCDILDLLLADFDKNHCEVYNFDMGINVRPIK